MAPFTLLTALTLYIGMVHCYPDGLPTSVCSTLMPSSEAPHVLQAGNGGYTISTDLTLSSAMGMYMYTAGQIYSVTVQAMSGKFFKGFLVRSQDAGGTPIGAFAPLNAKQQLLDCSSSSIPEETTIIHNNTLEVDFPYQTFNWTAPSNANGYVNFMYTLVITEYSYYGPLSAVAVANNRPAGVTIPTRTATDYRLILTFPEGCASPSACSIFVGIDTNAGNNAYLDVYLEATAQAWVAVGFSTTRSMFEADIVACNIKMNSTTVEAVDTWNGSPPDRSNKLDAIQDVYLFNGSIQNGRLSCTLARKTAGSDVPNTDLDLDGEYWVMYGWGLNQRADGALGKHTTTPRLSTDRINPSSTAAIVATPLVLALFAAIAMVVIEDKNWY